MAIPLSYEFLEDLHLVHDMKKLQKTSDLKDKRIWSWVRMTRYRKMMEVMKNTKIEEIHPFPKGLLHIQILLVKKRAN